MRPDARRVEARPAFFRFSTNAIEAFWSTIAATTFLTRNLMLIASRLSDILDLPFPVILIAIAFVIVGLLISAIVVEAIRTRKVSIYRTPVRLRDDPFSYSLNLAFTAIAAFACFYVASLLILHGPETRNRSLESSETTQSEPIKSEP